MPGTPRNILLGVNQSTTGTTTDDYVAVLTWEVVGLGKKQIWLKNTAEANGLKYKVLLYVSDEADSPLEKEFAAETTLAAAAMDEFVLERAYQKIIVQVKSAVAETAATYQIDYTGGKA